MRTKQVGATHTAKPNRPGTVTWYTFEAKLQFCGLSGSSGPFQSITGDCAFVASFFGESCVGDARSGSVDGAGCLSEVLDSSISSHFGSSLMLE